MKTTIEIEISDELIKKSAELILAKMFAPPNYSGDTVMPGYDLVKTQVREVIETMDLRDVIRAEAAKMVNGIVRDVVAVELKKRVKEAVKSEHEDGTLLSTP